MLAWTACSVLPEPVPPRLRGVVPVPQYLDSAAAYVITAGPPQPRTDARAFTVIGDTLYVVEYLRGVHAIDNRDPADPRDLAFLDVPGCVSVAARGTYLYVNNVGDLVTLDVSDPRQARVVDREPGLYPAPLDYPEGHVGEFECYDPARGVLLGWAEANPAGDLCFLP